MDPQWAWKSGRFTPTYDGVLLGKGFIELTFVSVCRWFT